MKVLITGATGFVGTPLVRQLKGLGHDVVVLSRSPAQAMKHFNGEVKAISAENDSGHLSAADLAGVEVVINLMGENISGGRWSDERKQSIRDSRVIGTQRLVESFAKSNHSELKVFINASAVGIYPSNSADVLTESSQNGSGFLADVCRDWEEQAGRIKKSHPHVRLAIFRLGVVLGPNGGALDKMLLPFKMGVGGKIASGKQMMSWIHLDDLVNIFSSSVIDERYEGIFNATAPAPISNERFTKALGSALGRPTLFPVPAIALKLMFGEMSSIILDSQDVRPEHLKQIGHQFKFPEIEGALKDIVS